MKALKRQVLQEKLNMLVDNFTPQRYLPVLQFRGLLDKQDCETICHEVTNRGKVMKLVEFLPFREGLDGSSGFDMLVEVIKKEGFQAHAAEQLQEALERAVKKRKREKVKGVWTWL